MRARKSLNTIMRNLAYGTKFDLESYNIGGGYHSHSSTPEAGLCDICNRSCSYRRTATRNTNNDKLVCTDASRIFISSLHRTSSLLFTVCGYETTRLLSLSLGLKRFYSRELLLFINPFLKRYGLVYETVLSYVT
jgi:hypothetical protein